jgi:hypothetical protein
MVVVGGTEVTMITGVVVVVVVGEGLGVGWLS